MNFDDCVRAAVAAGHVEKRRADAALKEFEDRVKARTMSGMAEPDARAAAMDDVIESFTANLEGKRHATLRQLNVMEASTARYGGDVALKDPDLLVRDILGTEREWHGLRAQVWGGMRDFLKHHSADLLGRIRDPAQMNEVLGEVMGEATGNVAAKAFAEALTEQVERLRVLYNSLGGNIRKLEGWGMPHVHDVDRIRKTGYDAWSASVYQRADWARIVNFKTGKPFAVAKGALPFRDDVDDFLKDIYATITTKGWIDRTPNLTGGIGARASGLAGREEHRVLHFKTAADWLAYNDEFGAMNPMDAILGHINQITREIAVMRAFGPNPRAGIRHAIQVMQKTANTSTGPDVAKIARRVDKAGQQALVTFDTMTGAMNRPVDQAMAEIGAVMRIGLTTAQLGSVPLTQVGDYSTMTLAAMASGLNARSPFMNTMRVILGQVPDDVMKDLGFIMDTWANSGAAGARYMGEVWTPETVRTVSNGILRSTGMGAMTDRHRVGVAMAFGSDIAGMADKPFDELPPGLRRIMQRNRFGAREWDAVRAPEAIYTDVQGGKHLNPTWFRRHTSLSEAEAEDISIKFSAVFQHQIERAIPQSTLRTRSMLLAGARPGTLGGELLLSMRMYKTFAFQSMFNSFEMLKDIIADASGAKRLGIVITFLLATAAMTTAAGAIAIQLKQVSKGQSLRPMDNLAFWGAAALQGGGLGIFGDFLSASTSRAGGGFMQTATGPVIGFANDVLQLTAGNIIEAAQGKDTNAGREAVRFARRYNPLSSHLLVRTALDRAWWDNLQRLVDPDYQADWARAEKQMKRDYGTHYTWERGAPLPGMAGGR